LAVTTTWFPHLEYATASEANFREWNNHYAAMNRIQYFMARLPVVALARDVTPFTGLSTVQKTDFVSALKKLGFHQANNLHLHVAGIGFGLSIYSQVISFPKFVFI
jgi:hypothetical protein